MKEVPSSNNSQEKTSRIESVFKTNASEPTSPKIRVEDSKKIEKTTPMEILPPYNSTQMKEFAINVNCQPPTGYPALEQRLFLTPQEIDEKLDGNVLFLPPGHDALGSPNRSKEPKKIRDKMDPEIVTGGTDIFIPKVPYSQKDIRDQHNRPVHPGYKQLLSLTSKDGKKLGMGTGIGQFYYYGPNGVADAAGVFRVGDKGEVETPLVRRPGTPQSPRGGWATPGGYEEIGDRLAEDSSIACARRELLEETGLEVRSSGIVVASMLPVSSVHTLNAWSKTGAVAFLDEDPEYLHDTELRPGDEVEDVGWFRVKDILKGEVE